MSTRIIIDVQTACASTGRLVTITANVINGVTIHPGTIYAMTFIRPDGRAATHEKMGRVVAAHIDYHEADGYTLTDIGAAPESVQYRS